MLCDYNFYKLDRRSIMEKQQDLPIKSDAGRLTPQQKSEIVAVFERHINKGQVAYLRSGHLDVIETKREGVNFTDPVSGRNFVDAFSSAGSFNVGRHNTEVMAALTEALDEMDMGTSHLVSPYKVALAKKLVEIAPGDVNRVLFAAGGGDAIDAALKLARAATGHKGIIATIKGYHGHTGFALSANGKEHYRKYFEPLGEGFRFVPFNDLDAMAAVVSDEIAVIVVEPVQGEAGIYPGTTEYLQGLRKLCDDHGILLLFDEIQTGFCRTGKMFASEHSGVVPDIMTVAKSIGGGLFPNAAMLYRDIPMLTKYVDTHPDFHPTYTGGSDLGCAVSLKVIEYLEKNEIAKHVETMGAKLKEALVGLMNENPKIIKEVRGVGLMIGIEYLHEFMGPMMSDALAKQGVFAAYSGNAPQVMRFMVPLVISEQEMNHFIDAIYNAVASMKTILPLALPAAKFPPILKLLNNEKVQTSLFSFLRKIEDAFSSEGGAK